MLVCFRLWLVAAGNSLKRVSESADPGADRFAHLTLKKGETEKAYEEKSEVEEKFAEMQRNKGKKRLEEARERLRSKSKGSGSTSTEEEQKKKALGVLLSSPAEKKNDFEEPSQQYTYEELKKFPPTLDRMRLDEYLREAEFGDVMGMERASFQALPGWKRKKLKKDKGLL